MVSNLVQKELGSHYSLTTSEKLNNLKIDNSSEILQRSEDLGQTSALQVRETDRRIQSSPEGNLIPDGGVQWGSMNSGFISSVKYAEGLPRPSLLKLSFIFMNLWHNFHFISIMLTNLVSYTVLVGVL